MARRVPSFEGLAHGGLSTDQTLRRFHLRVVVAVWFSNGEFDPGSGRTLAARLTHASRGRSTLRGVETGERVRNT